MAAAASADGCKDGLRGIENDKTKRVAFGSHYSVTNRAGFQTGTFNSIFKTAMGFIQPPTQYISGYLLEDVMFGLTTQC
jgi:hypothetical protein